MTLLLSRRDVEALLPMQDAIRIVEEAFRQLALGNVVMPQRTAIKVAAHGGLCLVMPALIGGEVDALAVKVVTVYPDNPARHDLPTTIGALLLNDPRTGAPLALMDASHLTAMRTGAASGVATKHLARADARRVGVFGAGVQAKAQLVAMRAVRPIDSAFVYDTDPGRASAYAAEMSRNLGIAVQAVDEPRRAVEGMDIIIAASSASRPIFDGAWLAPGQHINGVGSHSPGAREIDTTAVKRARVVADLPEACWVEAGDLMIPLSENAIGKEHVRAGLGEVVAGLKPGRESAEEITLFKSVGLALQDASTAAFVYHKAREAGAGVDFAF